MRGTVAKRLADRSRQISGPTRYYRDHNDTIRADGFRGAYQRMKKLYKAYKRGGV